MLMLKFCSEVWMLLIVIKIIYEELKVSFSASFSSFLWGS